MSAQTDQLTQDVANLTTIVTGLQTAMTAIVPAFAALQAATSNPNLDISQELTDLETAIGTAGQVLTQAQGITSPASTTGTDATTSPAAGA